MMSRIRTHMRHRPRWWRTRSWLPLGPLRTVAGRSEFRTRTRLLLLAQPANPGRHRCSSKFRIRIRIAFVRINLAAFDQRHQPAARNTGSSATTEGDIGVLGVVIESVNRPRGYLLAEPLNDALVSDGPKPEGIRALDRRVEYTRILQMKMEVPWQRPLGARAIAIPVVMGLQ